MKVRKWSIAFGLLIILLIFPLIVAYLREGRVTPNHDKKIRIEQLNKLRIAVLQELKRSNDYDNCFYHIYQVSNEKRMFYGATNPGDLHRTISDLKEFCEAIDYVFYHSSNTGKWFIIEKRADAIVPNILAIDQNGKPYEMEAVQVYDGRTGKKIEFNDE